MGDNRINRSPPPPFLPQPPPTSTKPAPEAGMFQGHLVISLSEGVKGGVKTIGALFRSCWGSSSEVTKPELSEVRKKIRMLSKVLQESPRPLPRKHVTHEQSAVLRAKLQAKLQAIHRRKIQEDQI